ncbi:putative mitochondria fission 1 protein [Helianthus annuus]|uniref:Mitochondria fission 1 protein n=2 Tax=Helianthus annuus TaxID=4232 RepID=A0A9K3I379_HELAN|nr:putative mitochondria fission 1 protein [Helianthus annuus]KAJ0532512.1 putative mitochondria fission 1 protein [Helianthus annuus]KAJ0540981.1 putative mitochondria fission 1 protein [Helianthus annuus]
MLRVFFFNMSDSEFRCLSAVCSSGAPCLTIYEFHETVFLFFFVCCPSDTDLSPSFKYSCVLSGVQSCPNITVNSVFPSKSECLLRLSWALVHSKRPEDVQRGIAMLEGSLPSTSNPLQMREKMYLLAVGYYRSGDYSRSRQLVDRCLEIVPDWRQAITLKKSIEDHIKKVL